ncbi:AAA family ATPase [Pedobacter miscanthi]|uniref:AAA family ATPase n=1 Tax=Pedobacter miscanthi TaxID=2259170 RepID=UPI00292DA09D|nr:AAA family ATPase [Pedobacter miscanthi]
MNILTDIITWAETKSKFWQTGIDMLIRNNTLTAADIGHLKEICRSEVGLSNKTFPAVDFASLRAFVNHASSDKDIIISKIHNIDNINALSLGSSLDFADKGMTVVYGDNGAGKSSFVSILKHVCNTRGQKPSINDNVYDVLSKGKDKKADVEYSDDGTVFLSVSLVNGKVSGDALKGVDVFDTSSAHHYIAGEDEIAFIPQGLSYVEKLSAVLQQIDREFNAEIVQLNGSKFDISLLGIDENSAAGKFLSSINKNTTLDDLRSSGTWNLVLAAREKELETIIATLRATDPEKTIVTNAAKITRYKVLKDKFDALESVLISQDKLDGIVSTVNTFLTTQETLRLSSEGAFSGLPIAGVGGDSWKQLWESARKFYNGDQSPGEFPETGEDSKCPLCFQDLSADAKARFLGFENFVQHDTQQKHNKAKITYDALVKQINAVSFDFTDQEPTSTELEGALNGYQAAQVVYLRELEAQRNALIAGITAGKKFDALKAPVLTENSKTRIDEEITKLDKDIEELKTQSITDLIATNEKALDELRNSKKIFDYRPKLAREIYRQKKVGLLATCSAQCATRTVTTLSNQLASTYVTQNLREKFQEELKGMGFRNIKIETETKGVKGKQYHYLRLNEPNANGVALKDILSEGEHRCIALSTFLSELTLSEHKSTIIFDDPVSSLDHKWRDKIAKRIVTEAKIRQVIVFTHDITFLLMLQEHSEKQGSDLDIKSLTRKKQETGIIAVNPPWDALPVGKRIGILKNQYQQLEKIERTQTEEVYRVNVQHLYGKLRETWERFVEEVLLNGAIQRFGREIQTQRLSKITDITDMDYQKVDENMGKCSTYFLGHDSAGTLMQEPPPSSEFLEDLTALETLITDIRKRRK